MKNTHPQPFGLGPTSLTQPTGRTILTGQDKHQHIEISHGERAVTSADIATSRDGQGPARASLWAASGHIPPGSGARLGGPARSAGFGRTPDGPWTTQQIRNLLMDLSDRAADLPGSPGALLLINTLGLTRLSQLQPGSDRFVWPHRGGLIWLRLVAGGGVVTV